ncbi:MAG: carbohydrate ABC transporter permease [Alphaproteobacteria bacterium]|nr:MAG: carbohydrate ABC transporter permease [Alphaproteobacteria bacterium]
MFPAPVARASRLSRMGYRAALFLSLALWLLPLAGVALTSVRSIDDLTRGNLWGWPSETRLVENYAAVFSDSRMAQFILNSVLITLPAVAGAVALACMAGFALAKFRFRGNLLLFVIFIAGNLVPFQILMIPVRDIAIETGIYDTRWALILFHVAFQTGFCTLFMRNFIKQLPDAMLDAARIEGSSELGIFWHIVLPLVRPAIAAIAALTFTFVWNDYFWSLVLVQSDDVRPLTAGLQSLRGMWLASWNLISAGSIIAAIPPVLLFLLMQQHFIAGLTAGAESD